MLLGDGTGGFTPAAPIVVPTASFVASVDLDGDGRLDLVVANEQGSQVRLFFGSGDGTFAETTEPLNFGGGHTLWVAPHDYDADGHADLARSDHCR